jgi:aminoglycoside 3-N-acetyltransferase
MKKIQTFNSRLSIEMDKFCLSPKSIVFIHVDLSNYLEASTPLIEKCRQLYNFLDTYFENSTIIIPTFTYSFCKTRKFDVNKSRSEVGVFTEYFREKTNNLRSLHPILSVCGKGKIAKDIVQNISNYATGDGSVFEKLKVFDGKILFLGADFIETCTFNHHTEQSLKVNYRYSKFFEGKIIQNNKIIKDKWELYVKNTEVYKFEHLSKNKYFEKDLLRRKILKKTKVDNFVISCCSTINLYDFVKKSLIKNENYILGTNPTKL